MVSIVWIIFSQGMYSWNVWVKKVLLNKWIGKNLLQGNYSRNTCWINEWILNEWINVHMNKWMHGFTCFQLFCYALCGSKEVVCEILQLTEDHIRFASPSKSLYLLLFLYFCIFVFFIIISSPNISTGKPVWKSVLCNKNPVT